jgi:hypothetical protein
MSYVVPLGTHTCAYAEYRLYRRLSIYALNEFSCVVPICELLVLERANVLDMSSFCNVNFTDNTRIECRVFKIGECRCLLGARYENRKYLLWGNSSQRCRWRLFLLLWLHLSLSVSLSLSHTHAHAHAHTQCAAWFNELHFSGFVCVWGGGSKIKTHNGWFVYGFIWYWGFWKCAVVSSCPLPLLLDLWFKQRELRNSNYVRSLKQCVEPIENATKSNSFSTKLVSTEKFGISHRGGQKITEVASYWKSWGRHTQIWWNRISAYELHVFFSIEFTAAWSCSSMSRLWRNCLTDICPFSLLPASPWSENMISTHGI